MDEIETAIARDIEERYGWMRRVEITARAAASAVAAVAALALALGLWAPSEERSAQWLLAVVLAWAAARLLRSVVGAMGS